MHSLRMLKNEHGVVLFKRTYRLLSYFYAKAVELNNMSKIKPNILQE